MTKTASATTDDNHPLAPYATPRQLEYILAVERHGSSRKAARALGIGSYGAINRSIALVKRRAAASEPSLHARRAPPGYVLGGVSTLSKLEDGSLQWVKTKQDHEEALQSLRDAAEEIAEVGRGRLTPLPKPKRTDDEILSFYPLTDSHVGMLAWAPESGANWDLEIAERTICASIDELVASAPPARQALFANMGDFLHIDSYKAMTPAHGHLLDADGRYPKVAMVGLRILRHYIDRLLQKHETVHAMSLSGNHDEASGVMIALVLAAAYEREPRLKMSLSPARMQVMEHGRNLIAIMHGHTASKSQSGGYLAAEHAEAWGRTKHRFLYRGHVHHDSSEREEHGVIVETLRTLAQKDAYAAGAMYSAGRDLKCDVFHRDTGRRLRLVQPAVDHA